MPNYSLTSLCVNCSERLDQDISGILATTCDHSFQCSCVSVWVNSSCPVINGCFALFIICSSRATQNLLLLLFFPCVIYKCTGFAIAMKTTSYKMSSHVNWMVSLTNGEFLVGIM